MQDPVSKLIVMPFEGGTVPLPGADGKAIFFNALPIHPNADGFTREKFLCVQPERGRFLALERGGFTAVPECADDAQFELAVIAASQHRRVNEANFTKARNCVKLGSTILIAGLKTDGIASFKKFATRHGSLIDATSKFHGQVILIERGAHHLEAENQTTEPAEGFFAAPGMFSADKVDPGSLLLAEHLTSDISGAVADFGCGWGFLSAALLETGAMVTRLDLYDSYFPALAMAKNNVLHRCSTTPVETYWRDLTKEAAEAAYDWIIMNPPFHSGRKGDPNIGLAFIRKAAQSLNRKGKLLLVANSHLPYEKVLSEHFASVSKIAEKNGFKVLLAAANK